MWLLRKIGSDDLRAENSALQIVFIPGHTFFTRVNSIGFDYIDCLISQVSSQFCQRWYCRFSQRSQREDSGLATLFQKWWSLSLKTLLYITFCYQPGSSSTKGLAAVANSLGTATLKYTQGSSWNEALAVWNPGKLLYTNLDFLYLKLNIRWYYWNSTKKIVKTKCLPEPMLIEKLLNASLFWNYRGDQTENIENTKGLYAQVYVNCHMSIFKIFLGSRWTFVSPKCMPNSAMSKTGR